MLFSFLIVVALSVIKKKDPVPMIMSALVEKKFTT